MAMRSTVAGEIVPSSLLTLFLALTAASPRENHIRSGETWQPRSVMDTPGVNGVVIFSGTVRGARVGPLNVRRAYRAVETRGRNSVLRDIRIEGLEATELERDGIRLRGDIDGAVIRDFTLRMRDRPQSGGHLPEGIALMAGRNISISDGQISGFRMVPVKDRYTNGDGIAAERSVENLRIARVEANDNSDAGFDLKSSRTRLDALVARRNFRNYRFWHDVDAGTLTSVDPRNAHIWIGKQGKVRIDRLVARSSTEAPVFRIEKGGRLEVGRCDLSLPRETPIVAGDRTHVRLGPGCRYRERH